MGSEAHPPHVAISSQWPLGEEGLHFLVGSMTLPMLMRIYMSTNYSRSHSRRMKVRRGHTEKWVSGRGIKEGAGGVISTK